MAVLSWGRPLIEIALLGENETPGEWKSLGTPKQDSSQLSTEAGNKTEAIEEGGGVVVDLAEGDTITVIGGAWEDTVGVIQTINIAKQVVTINVELFGRETPVEISFAEVQKM